MNVRTTLYATFGISLWLALFSLSGATALRTVSFWTASEVAERTWELPKGGTFGEILASGVLGQGSPNRWMPRLYARATGIDRRIKPGRYALLPDWSPTQVLEQLALGTNRPLRVTIPPGYTLDQIALALESAGVVRQSTDWISLASPGQSAGAVDTATCYEGLIGPETYFFEEPKTPREVLDDLHQGWREFAESVAGTSDLKRRMPNGLTLQDTLVLASIIEKEAANPIEMATVSSVFHNRVRKNWPLGSAATLRYAVKDWSGSDRDLPVSLKSPYNTSKKPGLPPTPICVVGREALLAALHPVPSDYMFFVADGQGGLIFNRTHEEHIKSVAAYRKRERGNGP